MMPRCPLSRAIVADAGEHLRRGSCAPGDWEPPDAVLPPVFTLAQFATVGPAHRGDRFRCKCNRCRLFRADYYGRYYRDYYRTRRARSQRVIHCSLCGEVGHNAATCAIRRVAFALRSEA